jgi:thiamine-phosphate pyrophosphorylase
MRGAKKNIDSLHYVTNAKRGVEIIGEVEQVLQAGLKWIQLRIKDNSIDFDSVARDVRKLCDRYNASLIINDRTDVAKNVDANGVHLGQEDMSVADARKILGPDKIIGGTANTIEQCANLELSGVDYIGLGPFSFTETKLNLSPILGIVGYQKIVPGGVPYEWNLMSLRTPVMAIGGIKLEHISSLRKDTGVHGIAVSGLIANAKDKRKIVEQINTIWNG